MSLAHLEFELSDIFVSEPSHHVDTMFKFSTWATLQPVFHHHHHRADPPSLPFFHESLARRNTLIGIIEPTTIREPH
ncbi:hypothetical protein GALMADRAFT_133856 [Galerina marginata CBS 339.88]|uniref:Uncharacterized protein n=1 Tax=Galerina marginata (strain CBS 339.88) TaxID=685588 RepID=A0A067TN58_GALM3|nr:hypothetical protein GALMADRAFT_133856 [Galerina marginata CBS 339.88]